MEAKLEETPSDLREYEVLLDEVSRHLHSTHWIVLTVKKYIADLTLAFKTRGELRRKIEYLRSFISTVEMVDGGFPKWKGPALFDLQRANIHEIKLSYNEGEIAKEDFLAQLRAVSSSLDIGLKCALGEDQTSKEGIVAKMTKKMRAELAEILMFAEFL